jgi:hypothetical protein
MLIKIGIPILGTIGGALLSWAATRRVAKTQRQTMLDVTNANNRTELKKELGNWRTQRLDLLTTSFDSFCQKLATYVTAVENAIETKRASTYSSQQLTIDKDAADFYGAFLDLLNVESQLLILGYPDLQKQLREFGEQAQEIYSAVNIRDSALTVDQIKEKMVAVLKRRLDLLVSLGDAERKWWET